LDGLDRMLTNQPEHQNGRGDPKPPLAPRPFELEPVEKQFD
jgi:hypothetical protein